MPKVSPSPAFRGRKSVDEEWGMNEDADEDREDGNSGNGWEWWEYLGMRMGMGSK